MAHETKTVTLTIKSGHLVKAESESDEILTAAEIDEVIEYLKDKKLRLNKEN